MLLNRFYIDFLNYWTVYAKQDSLIIVSSSITAIFNEFILLEPPLNSRPFKTLNIVSDLHRMYSFPTSSTVCAILIQPQIIKLSSVLNERINKSFFFRWFIF